MNEFQQLVSLLINKEDISISLQELQKLYLNNSMVINRYDTFLFYKRMLRIVIDFFESIGIYKTIDVTVDSVNKFIAFEKIKGNQNITINKRINALKQAFKYCYKFKYISTNQLSEFDLLKEEEKEVEIINSRLLKMNLQYLQTPSNKEELRSKLIIYLLIDTGVRRNELRHITLNNVDLDTGEIYLEFTKTSKHRTVFISESTINTIKEYLKVINPLKYLVTTLDGKNILSDKSIDRLVYKIKRKLNIPNSISISFHKFRHTYASMCCESGADIEFIRKTLGHSSLLVTKRYLHKSKVELKRNHTSYSPLTSLL